MNSLANKYRPQSLKDLKGQEYVVKFLSHLLVKGINKNIIFKGEFGTGKTTSARIYSKALLCKNRSGSVEPCNHCESCLLFDSKQNKDYLEFDAASKGSIENIRSLLDSFNIPPIFSKKKIWVVDEAHSMSPKAWDSLLKTIEEPKEFQTILFCTNYPEKIRPAILSRCSIIELSKLSESESIYYLSEICKLENIKICERSLRIISYQSKGHSRDLLKNLEHASQYGEEITPKLCRSIFFGNSSSAFNIIKALFEDNFLVKIDDLFSGITDSKTNFDLIVELFLYLKARLLYNIKIEDLSVSKIFLEEDLLVLMSNINSSSSKYMCSTRELFSYIDDVLFKSKINTIAEFKFFIFHLYESILRNILKISLESNEQRVAKKGRITTEDVKDQRSKKIKKSLDQSMPLFEEKPTGLDQIPETIQLEKKQETQSFQKKILPHELSSKHGFSTIIKKSQVIKM